MTAALSSSEPEAVRAIRALLQEDEEIFWAARSRGPTWREWFTFTLIGLFAALLLVGYRFTPGNPLVVVLLAGLGWYFVGSWFYVFAVTSRRVIILRTLAPRTWIFAEFSALDTGWLRVDVGRGKIQFGQRPYDGVFQPSGRWSALASQRGGMRFYIDNVPHIEAARDLIVTRIADAKATQSPEKAAFALA